MKSRVFFPHSLTVDCFRARRLWLLAAFLSVFFMPVVAEAGGCLSSDVVTNPLDCQYAADSNAIVPPPLVSRGVRLNPSVNVLFDNYGLTCRFVDNYSTNSYFVPQATLSEFSSFVENPPAGVVIANCVYPTTYSAAASLPAAIIELDAQNGPLTPAGPAVASVLVKVPMDQQTLGGIFRIDVNGTSPSTAASTPFSYTRLDCRVDNAGTKVCNTRSLVETQTAAFTTPTNPAPGSDHYWSAPTLNSVYLLDGTQVAAANVNYQPPALQACTMNGTSYPSGTAWELTTPTFQTPTASECPLGSGTRIDDMSSATSYKCNDGLASAQGSPQVTEIGYSGSCITSTDSCIVTLFGVQCATGQAQVEFYQLTPIQSSAGYDDLALPGGVDNLVSQDRLPDLVLNTGTINIPLQDYSIGFPGYSYLTQWFGVCYDGGYLVTEPGDYLFEVDADDGAVLWVDGTNFTEGGDWTVYNDNQYGNHPNGQGGYQPASGTAYLSPGVHDIVLKYFQGWPTQLGIQVYVTPPNGQKQIMNITQAPNGKLNCPL